METMRNLEATSYFKRIIDGKKEILSSRHDVPFASHIEYVLPSSVNRKYTETITRESRPIVLECLSNLRMSVGKVGNSKSPCTVSRAAFSVVVLRRCTLCRVCENGKNTAFLNL